MEPARAGAPDHAVGRRVRRDNLPGTSFASDLAAERRQERGDFQIPAAQPGVSNGAEAGAACVTKARPGAGSSRIQKAGCADRGWISREWLNKRAGYHRSLGSKKTKQTGMICMQH